MFLHALSLGFGDNVIRNQTSRLLSWHPAKGLHNGAGGHPCSSAAVAAAAGQPSHAPSKPSAAAAGQPSHAPSEPSAAAAAGHGLCPPPASAEAGRAAGNCSGPAGGGCTANWLPGRQGTAAGPTECAGGVCVACPSCVRSMRRPREPAQALQGLEMQTEPIICLAACADGPVVTVSRRSVSPDAQALQLGILHTVYSHVSVVSCKRCHVFCCPVCQHLHFTNLSAFPGNVAWTRGRA